tara:strand:+ start:1591 stop:1797 length:207 start_codon:yes stop_codon:yes gene_type:complete
MRPEHIEKIIDDAVYKVVWKDFKPKYEHLGDYIHQTMMDPEWDALEMFQYELMALRMRKQYGFNKPTE